jgi:hypothetical protein
MKVCDKDIKVQGQLIRIARLGGEGYDFLEEPEVALDALRRCGKQIDLFTFTQRLPETSPKYHYPMEWDNLAVLPVSTFDHWWTKQINDKTRNMARRAEKKGVTVREVPFDDALVQGISTIYDETPIRQGKPFWHYRKDLETVRRENGTFPDRSNFIGAFFEERLIGFAKLTSDEIRGQAGLMQILSMIQHRDKAPTNALIAQAVRSCADRGIPFLVYAQFSYGNKEWDGLAEFKHSNGFRQVDLPRYYVPMSAIGLVTLRLGLHRGLDSYIPGRVLAKFRSVRSRWYKYKLKVSQKAF